MAGIDSGEHPHYRQEAFLVPYTYSCQAQGQREVVSCKLILTILLINLLLQLSLIIITPASTKTKYIYFSLILDHFPTHAFS
jgi:hypothetical protein